MPKRKDPFVRFWCKVHILQNGCWQWTASKAARESQGYGLFRPGGDAPSIGAHIWAYRHFIGEIPKGLTLDHICRSRACVNPWHLDPVTNRINVLRGIGITANNARKTQCKNGHLLSGKNLRLDSHGWRRCRKCDVLKSQRYQLKHR